MFDPCQSTVHDTMIKKHSWKLFIFPFLLFNSIKLINITITGGNRVTFEVKTIIVHYLFKRNRKYLVPNHVMIIWIQHISSPFRFKHNEYTPCNEKSKHDLLKTILVLVEASTHLSQVQTADKENCNQHSNNSLQWKFWSCSSFISP